MNPHLSQLHPYPFERLNALQAGVVPPAHLPRIALHIGEPKHAPPAFVLETLRALAIARNCAIEHAALITHRNACALFTRAK